MTDENEEIIDMDEETELVDGEEVPPNPDDDDPTDDEDGEEVV